MKKVVALLFLCIGIIMLFVGCGANEDKAELLNFLHSVDKENAEMYYWYDNSTTEQLFSKDDVQVLITILAKIRMEALTENKEFAGITPEYGLRLIIEGENWYINQAGAPKGQSEISFRNKQWWIESAELREFMCSFLEKNT